MKLYSKIAKLTYYKTFIDIKCIHVLSPKVLSKIVACNILFFFFSEKQSRQFKWNTKPYYAPHLRGGREGGGVGGVWGMFLVWILFVSIGIDISITFLSAQYLVNQFLDSYQISMDI